MTTATCPTCGGREGRRLLEAPDRLLADPTTYCLVRCGDCGIVATHPRPADLERHYPEETYSAYQAARSSFVDRLRLHLTTAVPYRSIARRTPGRLLDVGCGAGDLAAAFKRRGWSVSGVEPSGRAARLAAEHGVQVHRGTLDDAPWPAGSFDAVVFNHSLEHVTDTTRALVAAHSLLEPGGLLGVTVPNFGGWQARLFGDKWFQLDVPRHLHHFDEEALVRLVERCGFEVARVRSTSMLAGLPASMQYALFGRRVLTGRIIRVPALALYPVLAAADLVVGGDCLNLVAEKPAHGR